MKILLSLVLTFLMGVSAVPSSKMLNVLYENLREICAADGIKVIYEEAKQGSSIVIIYPLSEVTKEELQSMPAKVAKDALMQGLLSTVSSEDTKEIREILQRENACIVCRLVTDDGGSLDCVITDKDLK